MRMLFLSISISLLLCGSASALCQQPPPKLCNIFFSSDLVVHAKVDKSEIFKDENDPDGIAGWLYYLDVLKVYRGTIGKTLVVSSSNDTSRLLLSPGSEYIVFASKHRDGSYRVGSTCGDIQGIDGEPYSMGLETKIQELLNGTSSVIEGEVRDSNWNFMSGAELTVIGNKTSQTVIVDKNGFFSVTVEPGTYKVLIPNNLTLTIYSFYVSGESLNEIRPLTLIGGQCVQIQLQER